MSKRGFLSRPRPQPQGRACKIPRFWGLRALCTRARVNRGLNGIKETPNRRTRRGCVELEILRFPALSVAKIGILSGNRTKSRKTPENGQ